MVWQWQERSSRSRVFFKIGVIKHFAIFTRKHLCWSLFLIKLQIWRAATLLKRLQHRYFSANIAHFFRTAFFIENLRWLLARVGSHKSLVKFQENSDYWQKVFCESLLQTDFTLKSHQRYFWIFFEGLLLRTVGNGNF